jgi:pseudouridine 5'-phosphatase
MWENNLNSFCSEIQECKGATTLVETLAKRNIPMAIATSSRAASVAKKRIHHERIFTPMAAVVTGDDPSVKNGKPAPDIFLEAARRLGVDPTDCLVFEDSTSGCQSAKAAGCFVIAVPDLRMEKSVFKGIADQVLDDLTCFGDGFCDLNLTVDE